MGGNASSGGWRSTPPSAGERYLNTHTSLFYCKASTVEPLSFALRAYPAFICRHDLIFQYKIILPFCAKTVKF